MTHEDKQLLLVDLCGRLPYGVKVNPVLVTFEKEVPTREIRVMNALHLNTLIRDIDNKEQRYTYKPYLYHLSSMTDEQKEEYYNLCDSTLTEWGNPIWFDSIESIDWLNANHFDYRRLIKKGLAIDCTNLNIY